MPDEPITVRLSAPGRPPILFLLGDDVVSVPVTDAHWLAHRLRAMKEAPSRALADEIEHASAADRPVALDRAREFDVSRVIRHAEATRVATDSLAFLRDRISLRNLAGG